MTNKEIRNIALECGFKLKEQPDGSLDLNPYVYEFAEKLKKMYEVKKDRADLLEELKEESMKKYQHIIEAINNLVACEVAKALIGGKDKLENEHSEKQLEAVLLVKDLREKINKLERQTKWKPIEIAPKDGTVIIIFSLYDSTPVIASWDDSYETFVDVNNSSYHFKATHWMNLPDEPGKGGKE